jgi:hypothetical protein
MRHHWAADPDGIIFCTECGYQKPPEGCGYDLASCSELIHESISHDWKELEMRDAWVCARCGKIGIQNRLRIVPANQFALKDQKVLGNANS